MPSAIVTVCAVLPSYITVVPPMRIVSAFGFGSAAGAMFCVNDSQYEQALRAAYGEAFA